MTRRLLLISGAVCSGKTTLASSVARTGAMQVFRTADRATADSSGSEHRVHLQRRVARLDRETNGEWVAEALAPLMVDSKPDSWIIVDCVHSAEQLDAVRRAWPREIVHIHLVAPDALLRERFIQRGPSPGSAFDNIRRSVSERRVDRLKASADVVLDTNRCTPEEILIQTLCHLGLSPKHDEELVDVLIGGQYGSEGKGQIAAHLAPEYSLLVRVGGPNAGHSVYLDPKPYAHHQLPSGTLFNPDATLLIGPGAVLRVESLLQEIADCGVTSDRLHIDPEAMIISDGDIEIEKGEEGLTNTVGSTGSGTGVATARRVLRDQPVADAFSEVEKAKDVPELRPYVADDGAIAILEEAYRRGERIFLEGTQGTGLSLVHGHYPYVTSRDTTVSGCLSEAGIAPARVRKVVMACRTYPIRVQNPEDATSGPMRSELAWADIADRSGIPLEELVNREKTTTTGRQRRVAEFDWVQLSRSALLNGPTDIALTFADYISINNRQANRVEQLTPETLHLTYGIERVTGARVSLVAKNFHHRGIIDRRVVW